MAVSHSGSMRANAAETAALRSRGELPHSDASSPEPEVTNRWHPAATLAFIVLSCGLLWGGIFAAFALFF